MKTVHLIISGKVQGVFFRASAAREAANLHITGWVKNNGENVEAMASGNAQQIDSFIRWAQKGPERAQVANVSVNHVPYQEFTDFHIIRG